MKYTRGQFTNKYYQLWEMGLLLPNSVNASIYSVKYRKNHCDEYSRVTLKAVSISDALERACYAITFASPWRPEDIDLQAVYDNEENLLWLDEPYYDHVQKKNEFCGMERREFLKKFGITGLAILYGFKPGRGFASTASVALGGNANGFSGEQLFTTPGSYSWTVPSEVTSVCVVAIGGGGGVSLSNGNSTSAGGGGGALAYANAISVNPGQIISVRAGSRGRVAKYAGDDASVPDVGESSFFGSWVIANAGTSGGAYAGNPSGGTVAAGTGFSGGAAGNSVQGGGGGGGGGGAGGYFGSGGTGGNGGNNSGGLGLPGVTGTNDGGSGGRGGDDGIAASMGSGSSLMGGTSTTQNGTRAYGAGGGGRGDYNGSVGTDGAVRIIWGMGRSFPSNAS